MAKKTTDYGRPSVYNQKTDPNDYGKGTDSETRRIYEQMTGDGLVSSQQKGKGNNNRK